MPVSDSEWSALREDVGYIRRAVEAIDKLDVRVTELERKWWHMPASITASIVAALAAAFGHHA